APCARGQRRRARERASLPHPPPARARRTRAAHHVMLIPLIASVFLATGPEQREFPPLPLADFTGTDARAFDDFLGHVVLVDFFAHWCAPCAKLVPHLNELADAYGVHGFQVFGITGDDQDKAVEWLTKLGAHYPHARDAGLALEVELGFRPLPFAVLV